MNESSTEKVTCNRLIKPTAAATFTMVCLLCAVCVYPCLMLVCALFKMLLIIVLESVVVPYGVHDLSSRLDPVKLTLLKI